MIYGLKKESNGYNLVPLGAVNRASRSRAEEIASLTEDSFGTYNGVYGKLISPPLSYSGFDEYQLKSETHSNALEFKRRNISGKGFEFHNIDANLKKIKDLKLIANKRYETLYEVINRAVGDYVQYGQAYIEVVGIDGNTYFYNSKPSPFELILNKSNNRPLFYKFNSESGSSETYISANYDGGANFRFLYSIKTYNSFSPFFGVPSWISAMQSIDINYAIDTWIESFMSNNARFDFLLVTTGQYLSEKQENKVKSTLTGAKGVENSGKGGILSLDSDSDVKLLELNKVDHSSFLDGKGEYIQQICQAHGLSGHSLGFSKGGKSIAGNEAIGALRKDNEVTIYPMQVKLENDFNRLFYMLFGVNPDMKFKRMDVVSDKEKAVIRSTDIGSGIISPSYARRKSYPDMTQEEIDEIKLMETSNNTNFEEKPDSFDDTQNYERADRR